MSNPYAIYKANYIDNMPSGVTYDSTIARFFYNGKSFFTPQAVESYRIYLNKFSGGSFDPANLTGLYSWISPTDASTTPAFVADLSGNGYNATQSNTSRQPTLTTLNGKQALDFTTAGTVLEFESSTGFSNFSSNDLTVFFTAKFPGTKLFSGGTVLGTTNPRELTLTVRNNGIGSSGSIGKVRTGATFGDAGEVEMELEADLEGVFMFRIRGGKNYTFSINGAERYGNSEVTDDIVATVKDYFLGANNQTGAESSLAIIGDFIVCEGILPISEVNDCGYYLANKWGMSWVDFGSQLDILEYNPAIALSFNDEQHLTMTAGEDYADDGSTVASVLSMGWANEVFENSNAARRPALVTINGSRMGDLTGASGSLTTTTNSDKIERIAGDYMTMVSVCAKTGSSSTSVILAEFPEIVMPRHASSPDRLRFFWDNVTYEGSPSSISSTDMDDPHILVIRVNATQMEMSVRGPNTNEDASVVGSFPVLPATLDRLSWGSIAGSNEKWDGIIGDTYMWKETLNDDTVNDFCSTFVASQNGITWTDITGKIS